MNLKNILQNGILIKIYKTSLKNIYSIYKKGYSVMDILDSYFTFIKITTILDENIKYKIIKLY